MNKRDSAHDPVAFVREAREVLASQLFADFAERLSAIAQQRLPRDLRSKVSPDDVVQSAFKSLFRRLDRISFDSSDPNSLWSLLVVIALRKCAKWEDHFLAEKRSVHREVSLGSPSTHIVAALWEVVAREPGPVEAAMFSETLEQLLGHFSPRQQQMILLRVEGCELAEIADRLESSRRTVARVIGRAKDVLRESLEDAAR